MATANWCSSDGFALAAHLTFSSQNKTPTFRHLQVYIKVSISVRGGVSNTYRQLNAALNSTGHME